VSGRVWDPRPPGDGLRGYREADANGWVLLSHGPPGHPAKRKWLGEGECDWCGMHALMLRDYRVQGWIDWSRPVWKGHKWCSMRCWRAYWSLSALPGSRGKRTGPKMKEE